MFYGLQKVNSVTLPDKKERAGIAGFGSGTCSLLKLHLTIHVFVLVFRAADL